MRFVGQLQGVNDRVGQSFMTRPLEGIFASFFRNLFRIINRFSDIDAEGRVGAGCNDVLSISAALHVVEEDLG